MFTRFPVQCVIYSKRGKNITKSLDQGKKFNNDKGEFYFRFKKLKLNTVPISFDYFYNTVGGNGKQFNKLYVFSPSPSLYFPIEMSEQLEVALNSGNWELVETMLPEMIRKIMENAPAIKIPIDEKVEQWLDWEGFRIYKNAILTDYKNSLERMVPQLVIMIVIIVAAVAMFIIFRGMEGMVASIAESDARHAAADQQYIDINNRLLDLVEQGKISVDVVKPPPPGV